uniref:F-box domain-containing protein n=1 Tax=Mycena chlorophos TaxID=658473 RepID=A0ABQ0LH89_MYCCL|nr:predicted protein [Mycena chlorophos]
MLPTQVSSFPAIQELRLVNAVRTTLLSLPAFAVLKKLHLIFHPAYGVACDELLPIVSLQHLSLQDLTVSPQSDWSAPYDKPLALTSLLIYALEGGNAFEEQHLPFVFTRLEELWATDTDWLPRQAPCLTCVTLHNIEETALPLVNMWPVQIISAKTGLVVNIAAGAHNPWKCLE